MSITPEHLRKTVHHLSASVTFNDLARRDWRRQTDAVKLTFVVARLFADLGPRVVFVDGNINDRVKLTALSAPAGVKGFFNRRLHDAGIKSRRVMVYDTFTTRKMGRRGSGRDKLHFHAAFELPDGWTQAELLRRLRKAFGNAGALGRRQFHVSAPRWDRHHSHNGVKAEGPIGKIMYAIAHAGATYRSLDLNNGKWSRRCPRVRGQCNRRASGLARGIPSNFAAGIIFCDHASKRAGKDAFEAWIKAEMEFKRSSGGSPEPEPDVQRMRAAG